MGQRTEIECCDPASPGRWERTCRVLIAAVGIEHAAAESARLGMPFGEFNQSVERIFVNDRVRIQNQHVFPGAVANSCIVSTRESKVCPVLYNPYDGILVAYKFHRAVSRPVIGHDDLE